MKAMLCVLFALAIVVVSASDSYALGRRGGGNMGMVCNTQTAALPTPAKAENLPQTAATRLVMPMVVSKKVQLDVAPSFAVDATALQALNTRKSGTTLVNK